MPAVSYSSATFKIVTLNQTSEIPRHCVFPDVSRAYAVFFGCCHEELMATNIRRDLKV